MTECSKVEKIVVGVVTYNNRPLLERCFASWRSVPNAHLVVWDNGSSRETLDWLRMQPIDKLFVSPENVGVCIARNRIIEYNRDFLKCRYLLLLDSDVCLHDYASKALVDAAEADTSAGMFGFGQANKCWNVDSRGYVEEIANECTLSKMEMWSEIGLYPETLKYYSGDSWKSTIANMHGWKTRIVPGIGYDHYAHGSTSNPGVTDQRAVDVEKWIEMESRFETYWRTRIILGKKGRTRHEARGNPDNMVEEERIDLDTLGESILMPDKRMQFTSDYDVKVLMHLFNRLHGNYLEVGCHRGLTTMQFAYNFPDSTCYGIDHSGPDTMPIEQKFEKPDLLEIGMHVKGFKNARTYSSRIDQTMLSKLRDVVFVFIDADLSYDGVKGITQEILQYLFNQKDDRMRIVAWHDYIPAHQETDEQRWIGVGKYIRDEVAGRLKCRWVTGSRIAYAVYQKTHA